MSSEEQSTGIPTRAIHEAYLEVQSALKEYRTAKDRGSKDEQDIAHGRVQESVVTFYEMLRPHIKDNSTADGYWDGEPPKYNRNGEPPDPEDGIAVLQVQRRTDHADIDQLDDADVESLETFEEWHEALGMNGDARLVGVVGDYDDGLVIQYDTYQLGLRHLDSWETKYQPKSEDLGGFMSGKVTTSQRRARIDMQRLKRAARELAQAAGKLGFLSSKKIPTEDDPAPIE